MNVQQAVPFFAVADIDASVHFYVDGVGFEMTQQWVDDGKLRWCRLQYGGAALMLQEFPTEGHDSWVPEGKVGEGVTIYFNCEDALAIYRAALANGIDVPEPRVGNGMWTVSFADPDGYRMIFQSDTDVAEDSALSEMENQ